MKLKVLILGGPTFTFETEKTAEAVRVEIATACAEKRPWTTPEGNLIGCNVLNGAVIQFEETKS